MNVLYLFFYYNFWKTHFHDVNYIKDEWYGNSFKDFILNMFDVNKNLRDKMLKFLYLSSNINLDGNKIFSFINSKEGYLFNNKILYKQSKRILYTIVNKKLF